MVSTFQFLEDADMLSFIVVAIALLVLIDSLTSVSDRLLKRFGITTKRAIKKEEEEKRAESMAKSIDNITVLFDDLKIQIRENDERSHQRYEELKQEILCVKSRQDEIEENNNNMKRNDLRKKLIDAYNTYSQAGHWNEMESMAFWSMYEDYIALHGNGYVEHDIKPVMESLPVININGK